LRIRYLIILIAVIVISASGMLLLSGRETVLRPRIVIVPLTWDLGRISEGEKHTNDFKICNEGEALLLLKSARPSCSCDTVTLSTDEIAPHGCAIMTVIFDATDRVGLVDAWVYVESNDPQQPLLQTKMLAKVVPRE
jgi:hypothetical protein